MHLAPWRARVFEEEPLTAALGAGLGAVLLVGVGRVLAAALAEAGPVTDKPTVSVNAAATAAGHWRRNARCRGLMVVLQYGAAETPLRAPRETIQPAAKRGDSPDLTTMSKTN